MRRTVQAVANVTGKTIDLSEFDNIRFTFPDGQTLDVSVYRFFRGGSAGKVLEVCANRGLRIQPIAWNSIAIVPEEPKRKEPPCKK